MNERGSVAPTGQTVSAGLARSLIGYAASRGVDPAALAAAAGVELSALEDHDARVEMSAYVLLVRGAKQMCDDPAFALHFAEAIDMSEFSVVGLLAHASETMMDALAQLNRYGRLVVEVDTGPGERFTLEQSDDGLWLIDRRCNPDDFPELTESTFTRLICGPRRFLPRPHVLEAHVTHPAPGHRDAYGRVFRCPVKFAAGWNALRMDPAMTRHPVAQQPRFVFGILSEHAEKLLRALEGAKTTSGRVKSLLMPVLHRGEASMAAAAGRLGVSRQTLYRKLKAEGTTFEGVLDDLRRELALYYLAGRKVSVNETAYLVGFSDPAAFSRAFKRWTGKSPREARGAAKQDSR